MNQYIKRALLAILLACSVLTGVSCSSDVTNRSEGHLEASPSKLLFRSIVGKTDTQETIVVNSGKGGVTISDITLMEDYKSQNQLVKEQEDKREFIAYELVDPANDKKIKLPYVLDTGKAVKIKVTFRAKDSYADQGRIRMNISGDPKLTDGHFDVELKSAKIGPNIYGEKPVIFEHKVEPGQWACKDVEYSNNGTDALRAVGYFLSDPPHLFHAQIFRTQPTQYDSQGNPWCDGTPRELKKSPKQTVNVPETGGAVEWTGNTSEILNIPPRFLSNTTDSQVFYVRYFFFPTDNLRQEAALKFDANIEDIDDATIKIIGNDSKYCLYVTGLDIPQSPVRNGFNQQFPVTIRNCSDDSDIIIDLSNFQLADTDGGQLDWENGTPPDPFSLAKGESKQIELVYSPVRPTPTVPNGEHNIAAKLIFQTNDPEDGQREYIIKGSAADNKIPEPIIKFKEGIADKFVTYDPPEAIVLGLTTSTSGTSAGKEIILQGNLANRSDFPTDASTTISYEWSLISSPMASGSNNIKEILKSGVPSDQSITLQIKEFGQYTLALHSTVNSVQSKIPALINIELTSPEDLSIQVRWTPNQASSTSHPGKMGPDIDLHLLYGNTSTWYGDKDTYYDRRQLVLGPGSKTNLRGDVKGSSRFGPEQMIVSNIPTNSIFNIGVQMFRDYGFTTADCHVIVKARGTTVYETGSYVPSRRLSQDQFWWVAKIKWIGGPKDTPAHQLVDITTTDIVSANEGDAKQELRNQH